MNNRNKIKFLVLFFVCGVSLFSETWESLIPGLTDKDLGYINAGKYTDRPTVNYKDGLELLPLDTGYRSELMAELEAYDPELCVEMLFVIDKPDIPENELMLYILNNFRAFSEQEGMEYYSSNRKKMYPLITKSYFVSDKNKKIDDPVAQVLPYSEEHKYFQDDSTFGSNYYKLKTRSTEKTIWIQMENLDKLTVFTFFKAVEEGGERVNFLITPVDDKIVLYALAQIKEEPDVKKVLKWKVNIPGSFKRRMSTIVEWFQKRIS